MKHIVPFLLIIAFLAACSTSKNTTESSAVSNTAGDNTIEKTIDATGENQISGERTGPVTHIVQKGESLWVIAQKYGITVKDIVAANNIEDPSLIMVGQKLIIPVKKIN